ncbi:hypothetical protein LZ198_14045 [Myxococcus sp. K15C18031901]|uniref:hypothetical protein n=1 Tax=Myxococcus dinghuensis TaxID=2906761 RepID=UPI0020A80768|nr:hypothetical protein [Myxococcus dinghuensis]MCP3099993.1 hypothetical protein [Myxococcus dinghuensis]
MTVSASRTGGLPGRIRFAALLGMILAALTGWMALNEAAELAHFSEARSLHRDSEDGAVPLLGIDPSVMQQLMETRFSSLEPMREPRALLLFVLAIACAFVFVSSARMLRPDGMRRDSMRRMLGRAAITVAVLRTIDGAQWAVVARRMGAVLAQSLASQPEYQDPVAAQTLGTIAPSMALGMTVLGTALVAGTFAVLGQYFRSNPVREALVALDGPAEE